MSHKKRLNQGRKDANQWFAGGPRDEADRKRFGSLCFEDKLWVEAQARKLCGRGHALAKAWKEALSQCAEPDLM